MTWLWLLAIIIPYFLLQLLYLLWMLRVRDEVQPSLTPSVSVLVAARNEEANILRCLQSMAALEYATERLEILIGNDRSEDNTAEVVAEFIQGKKQFRMVQIEGELGKARGKANVLAQLARQAKGELLLVTDADIRVQPQWVQYMAGALADPRLGIVSGTTIIEGRDFHGGLQQVEWLYYMSIMRVLAEVEPVTAVGNNMAVRRSAYESIGGYESIEFSVTEDFQLFRELQKAGWPHKHLHTHNLLNFSLPADGLKTLKQQRKRWLKGGLALPWRIWLMMILHGLFTGTLLLLLLLAPLWALMFFLLNFLVQSALLLLSARKLQIRINTGNLFLFAFYFYFSCLLMAVAVFLPEPVRWKGREYR